MSSETIYFVYRTTNIINGKIYVGVHKTKNIDDGYLGSGKHIQRAIKKCGKENFIREILTFTETYGEAFEMEELIVDEEFVESTHTYNIKLGGHGGFDHIKLTHDERCARGRKGGEATVLNNVGVHNPKYDECRKLWSTNANLVQQQNGVGVFDPEVRVKGVLAAQSEQANIKRIESLTRIKHQQGDTNSQFGTRWIYNPTSNVELKIKKDEDIPIGFILGRSKKSHS